MILDVQNDVQIAGRTAFRATFAFTRQPNLLTPVDAGRDLDGERLLLLLPALPATRLTGGGNHLALSLAPIAHDHIDELTKDGVLNSPQLSTALTARAGG